MKPWVCLALTIGLAGCVPVPHDSLPTPTTEGPAPKAGPGFPIRLAVLPFSNSSGNPDAAVIIRAMAVNKLGHDLGYIVQNPAQTDDMLHSRSLENPAVPLVYILSRTTPTQLSAWLGVDGFIYGDVHSYEKAKVSIFSTSPVKARFWLVDANGKKLWDVDKGADQGGFGSGSTSVASVLSDSNVPGDVQNKIQNSEEAGSALAMVNAAFASFPTR